jgi:hypothetical protein
LISYTTNDDSLHLETGFYKGRVWNSEGRLLREFEIGNHPFYGRDTTLSTRISYTFHPDGNLHTKTYQYKVLKNNLSWETDYVDVLRFTFMPASQAVVTDLSNKKTNAAEAFRVFPQPAHQHLYLQGIGSGETGAIRLYTLEGTLVKQLVTIGNCTLPLQDLHPGSYILHLQTSQRQESRLIIID